MPKTQGEGGGSTAAIIIVLVFVPSPYAWHSHLLPPVLFVALERLDLVSVEHCKWFVKQSLCLASCIMYLLNKEGRSIH